MIDYRKLIELISKFETVPAVTPTNDLFIIDNHKQNIIFVIEFNISFTES